MRPFFILFPIPLGAGGSSEAVV